MPIITYENILETDSIYIANTVMKKRFIDGVHKQYTIAPNEGYVLHDNLLDNYEDYDEQENPIGELILGYYSGTRTVAASYDFVTNPREFYAVLESSVPAD